MRKLAKPLPLDTPTTIELAPGNTIRVTLIDANHCVGAVMFLIEGDGKAILYTGDVRAEAWWVNSIVQNPVLAPYALGLRYLDCIYLDTTFATKRAPYRNFPSKADGVKELLEKISTYPDDTIYYFHAWTFGYEDVWVALSAFLGSQIHLDDYRARIYASLSSLDRRSLREAGLDVPSENRYLKEAGIEIREAAALCGFRNGNHIQPGCLTSSENVRIHSCERAIGCNVLDQDSGAKIVHIIPIISRSNGVELAELGAGGGKGDLDQKEELETGDLAVMGRLMELCAQSIESPDLLAEVLQLLQRTLSTDKATVDFGLHLQKESQSGEDDLSLQKLVAALSSNASKKLSDNAEPPLNKTIRFPYSRHSSYSELCGLVATLKPRDVFPCTVDESNWGPELSVEALFGEYCSSQVFRHDAEMMPIFSARKRNDDTQKRDRSESQHATQSETTSNITFPSVARPKVAKLAVEGSEELHEAETNNLQASKGDMEIVTGGYPAIDAISAVSPEPVAEDTRVEDPLSSTTSSPHPRPPTEKTSPWPERKRKLTNTHLAYHAAIGTYLTWADFGGLESARNSEAREEEIL